MIRTVLAGTALIVLTALLACGGGDDEPETNTIILRPVLSQAPDQDPEAVLETLATVSEARAEAYSGLDATAMIADDQVTITYSGIEDDVANAVFGRRGVLDFRHTLTDDSGFIICQAADGTEFIVPPTLVNPDPVSGQRARCFTQDTVGNPVWETAVVTGFDGQPQSITNASVEPSSWMFIEGDQSGLTAKFTPEGSEILTDITAQLVGYPLGIFLDAELIGAPVIQRPITDGAPVITGFDLAQARIYAAVLDGGPLPVDIQITSAAE